MERIENLIVSQMRHLSAYLLLVLGGNEKPSVGVDCDVFDSVGC